MFWNADKGSINLRSPLAQHQPAALPGSARTAGPPPPPSTPARPPVKQDPPKPGEPKSTGSPKPLGDWFLFWGVLLPIVALAFEWQTHYCARHFFDPFPSAIHAILFSLIPTSNLCVYLAHRKDLSSFYAPMVMSSGMAFGIGILYTLMLIPLIGICIPAILLLGFGLLGLSPLCALHPTWKAGEKVCELAHKHGVFFNAKQLEHLGHAIILITVIIVEIPSTFTRVAMHAAAKPASQEKALDFLRKFGSQEVMLRACYERSGRATDIIGSLYDCAEPMSVEQARNIFYRVTGRSFNSFPIPPAARATMAHANVADVSGFNAGVEDEFDFDPDIAGETVSGVARGLSAKSSRMAVSVNNSAAYATVNWNLEFNNASQFDREARARILLPHNGVVTRASVVIDGKEHVAKIMLKQQARAVYRQNAEAKKDPLLVSSAGLDRVLLQCYPVRPEQQVVAKLTIVAPLEITQQQKGSLALPTFEERNFQLDADCEHEVDANGQAALSSISPDLKVNGQPSHLFGKLHSADLSKGLAVIDATLTPKPVWATLGDYVVEPTIAQQSAMVPPNVFFVIDGSAPMEQYMPQIAEAMKELPSSSHVKATFVSDQDKTLEGSRLADELSHVSCVGGQDDSNALLSAVQAIRSGEDVVVWIHGAQPENKSAADTFKYQFMGQHYRWACRGQHPVLYDMQVSSGSNPILDSLQPTAAVDRVAHIGSAKDDLVNLFDSWKKGGRTLKLEPSASLSASGPAAPAELSQLCAYSLSMRELRIGNSQAAYRLAETFDLVTPISSAIVVPNETIRDTPVVAAIKAKTVIDDVIRAAKAPAAQLQALSSVSDDREMQREREEKAMDPMRRFDGPAPSPMAMSAPAAGGGMAGDQFAAKDEAYMDFGSRNKVSSYNTGGVASPPPSMSFSAKRVTDSYTNPYANPYNGPDAGQLALQGATNGTLAPQSNEVGAIDGMATAAPVEAKPAPESDTWLLLIAASGLLGMFVLHQRRKPAKT